MHILCVYAYYMNYACYMHIIKIVSYLQGIFKFKYLEVMLRMNILIDTSFTQVIIILPAGHTFETESFQWIHFTSSTEHVGMIHL